MHRAGREWRTACRQRERCIMGVVKAVCTSNIKGIQKTEQDAIELKSDWGIEGTPTAGRGTAR